MTVLRPRCSRTAWQAGTHWLSRRPAPQRIPSPVAAGPRTARPWSHAYLSAAG